MHIIIETKVLSPRKRFKASLNRITIRSAIMPNGSKMRRWWRNFKVDLAVDYIMMTFRIKGRACARLENKIRLISEDEINASWILMRSKVGWF